MDEATRKAIQSYDIPNPFRHRSVIDYHLCVGTEELQQTLREINREGYPFLCATQDKDVYTIFFRRPGP